MRRFFGKFENGKIIIEGDDFLHLKSVLRLNVGDEVQVSTGEEFFYNAKISELKKNFAVCQILNKVACDANPKKRISLFMALSKGEKMELVLQKATELGLTDFFLFDSEFAVKKGWNMERYAKITREACKQCGRSVPVCLENREQRIENRGGILFKDLIEKLKEYKQVLFANEKGGSEIGKLSAKQLSGEPLAIVIGAEGGFSAKEIEALEKLQNVTAVTLGKRILRCETAAIALAAFVVFKQQV